MRSVVVFVPLEAFQRIQDKNNPVYPISEFELYVCISQCCVSVCMCLYFLCVRVISENDAKSNPWSHNHII